MFKSLFIIFYAILDSCFPLLKSVFLYESVVMVAVFEATFRLALSERLFESFLKFLSVLIKIY